MSALLSGNDWTVICHFHISAYFPVYAASLVEFKAELFAWQSFIRTRHLLSSKLPGVIPDKPFAVVHIGRDYPGQATLAWRNPA